MIQIYGISDNGLDDSRGWDRGKDFAFFGIGKTVEKPVRPTETVVTPSSDTSAPVQHNRPDKYEFGIHISKLDIANEHCT